MALHLSLTTPETEKYCRRTVSVCMLVVWLLAFWRHEERRDKPHARLFCLRL